MPHADPSSSFEAASRHLFRHIKDVDALRTNPIVRPFFGHVGKSSASVIPRIHAAILSKSAEISACSEARFQARACRRNEIVVALCAGRTASETAARFGISIHHYYRERRAICTLIVRALIAEAEQRPKRFEISDPLRLLFARAEALRDQGFAGRAVGVLEDALSRLSDSPLKPLLHSELGRALIAFGNLDGAAAVVGVSEPRPPRTGDDRVSQLASEHHVLTRVQLAKEMGHDTEIGKTLELLVKSKIAQRRCDDEAVSAIVECGDWYCQNGMFNQARGMLRHAGETAERIPHLATRQRVAITLLAAHCAQDARDDFELDWLNEALSISIANGSVCGILSALIGLMYYFVSAGDDDGAYDLARDALDIAQTSEGTYLLEMVGIQIVGALIRTRHWRAGCPLMFDIERLSTPGSIRWTYLKEFQGHYFTRKNDYARAQAALVHAYESAKNIGNAWLQGLALRDLALARDRSGCRREAGELIRHAVELVEGRSSTISLWVTYDAAARLLGDRRIARRAELMRTELAARSGKWQSHSGDAKKATPSRGILPRLRAASQSLSIGIDTEARASSSLKPSVRALPLTFPTRR